MLLQIEVGARFEEVRCFQEEVRNFGLVMDRAHSHHPVVEEEQSFLVVVLKTEVGLNYFEVGAAHKVVAEEALLRTATPLEKDAGTAALKTNLWELRRNIDFDWIRSPCRPMKTRHLMMTSH